MSSFIIRVKTGNKWGAATSANVKARLYDTDGMKTRWLDLEVGQFNKLQMMNFENVAIGNKIDKVEIRRDKFFFLFRTPDWYAEYMEVESVETSEIFYFPIHRWIVRDRHYMLRQYDAMLPGDDGLPEQRNTELEEKKKLYDYYLEEDGFPVGLHILPNEEKWTLDWQSHQRTRGIKLTFERWFTKVNTVCFSWSKVKDMEKLFETVSWGVFHKPKDIIDRWNDDKWFGAQRLCGIHPFVIEQCKEIPEKLGVSEEDVNALFDDDEMTLQTAVEAKKIYIVDLKTNEEIGFQNDLEPYGPIALFYVNDDNDLMPIAIQLRQEKGDGNPVFYPSDDDNLWTIAKLWFNMADGFYHQALTHLGTCHMLIDGIAVCTHRNLSPSHPIYKLLIPHFHNTLAINSRIPDLLNGPHGVMNETHRLRSVGLNELLRQGFKDFRMDVQADLVNDLKNRGVDETDDLPNYHYRDDALLIWWAILKYAEKIIKFFYSDDEKVHGDTELQSWGAEMTKPYPDGVELKGIPSDGTFATREEVISLCVQIMYTASVKHCAVNNPQYEQYAWTPNMPTWLQGERPRDKKPRTDADVVKTLPTKDLMIRNMSLMSFVSEQTENNILGHFMTTYFLHPETKEIHKEFLEDLKEVSNTIKDRNDERRYKYEWLDPQHVGNSIYI